MITKQKTKNPCQYKMNMIKKQEINTANIKVT